MKTAKEMINYIKENGCKRSHYSMRKLEERAKIVENQLNESEEVLTCFVAQRITKENNRSFPSIIFTPFTFAYGDVCFVALTNRRIIQSQINNLFIKEKNVLTIELTYLNDITQNKNIIATQIIIDTINENAGYVMFNRYGSITYRNFQNTYAKIKENQEKEKGVKALKTKENMIEETESTFEKESRKDPKLAMTKVKELFHAGLITEKQYQDKVNEILKEI